LHLQRICLAIVNKEGACHGYRTSHQAAAGQERSDAGGAGFPYGTDEGLSVAAGAQSDFSAHPDAGGYRRGPGHNHVQVLRPGRRREAGLQQRR